MIIPVAALALLLLPGLLGGRLGRLGGIRLQGTPWLIGAFAAQFVVIEAFGDPGPLLRAALETVHVGSYVVAGWFLWRNRQVPWLWLAGAGAASNGITIALNDGTLPARAGALRTAGLDVTTSSFVNSGVVSHPRLPWLGDVFAIPGNWPLANVFSVGDLTLLTGVALASIWICGTTVSAPWHVPTRFRRPQPSVRVYPEAFTHFVFPPLSPDSSPGELGHGPRESQRRSAHAVQVATGPGPAQEPPDLGGNWQSRPVAAVLPRR